MKSKVKNEYEDLTMSNESSDQSNKNHKIHSRSLQEHIDKSSRDRATLKAGVVPESSVSQKTQRRSGRDRRKLYDIYFVTNGEFKKCMNERRSGNERRDGWKRVSEWGSIPLKQNISNNVY